MKIALGADKLGFQLKEAVKAHLLEQKIEVEDYGVQDPEGETAYYDIADQIGKEISNGTYPKAILVCGTGMGMAIIANKHPGVYAAVCENETAAAYSRSINDSNVLSLGGMITDPDRAKGIVDVWLRTEFTQDWDKPIVDWLHNSKKDISRIETNHFKK